MDDGLFTRDEILGGGLSRVRRARAVLYLIESEARRIADQRSLTTISSPESGMMAASIIASDPETMRSPLPGEADEAFIESFRNARRRSGTSGTRTLVHTLSAWRVLVPEDLALRAEVLHQMSLRHQMPANRTETIALAFGVGDEAFDAAYRSTVGSSSDTAFAPDMSWFSWWRAGNRS